MKTIFLLITILAVAHVASLPRGQVEINFEEIYITDEKGIDFYNGSFPLEEQNVQRPSLTYVNKQDGNSSLIIVLHKKNLTDVNTLNVIFPQEGSIESFDNKENNYGENHIKLAKIDNCTFTSSFVETKDCVHFAVQAYNFSMCSSQVNNTKNTDIEILEALFGVFAQVCFKDNVIIEQSLAATLTPEPVATEPVATEQVTADPAATQQAPVEQTATEQAPVEQAAATQDQVEGTKSEEQAVQQDAQVDTGVIQQKTQRLHKKHRSHSKRALKNLIPKMAQF